MLQVLTNLGTHKQKCRPLACRKYNANGLTMRQANNNTSVDLSHIIVFLMPKTKLERWLPLSAHSAVVRPHLMIGPASVHCTCLCFSRNKGERFETIACE